MFQDGGPRPQDLGNRQYYQCPRCNFPRMFSPPTPQDQVILISVPPKGSTQDFFYRCRKCGFPRWVDDVPEDCHVFEAREMPLPAGMSEHVDWSRVDAWGPVDDHDLGDQVDDIQPSGSSWSLEFSNNSNKSTSSYPQDQMQCQMAGQMQGPPRMSVRQEPMYPQGPAPVWDRFQGPIRGQMQGQMPGQMQDPRRMPVPQAPMYPQGQMQGQVQGQVQGQMPGQMQGQMPGQMQDPRRMPVPQAPRSTTSNYRYGSTIPNSTAYSEPNRSKPAPDAYQQGQQVQSQEPPPTKFYVECPYCYFPYDLRKPNLAQEQIVWLQEPKKNWTRYFGCRRCPFPFETETYKPNPNATRFPMPLPPELPEQLDWSQMQYGPNCDKRTPFYKCPKCDFPGKPGQEHKVVLLWWPEEDSPGFYYCRRCYYPRVKKLQPRTEHGPLPCLPMPLPVGMPDNVDYSRPSNVGPDHPICASCNRPQVYSKASHGVPYRPADGRYWYCPCSWFPDPEPRKVERMPNPAKWAIQKQMDDPNSTITGDPYELLPWNSLPNLEEMLARPSPSHTPTEYSDFSTCPDTPSPPPSLPRSVTPPDLDQVSCASSSNGGSEDMNSLPDDHSPISLHGSNAYSDFSNYSYRPGPSRQPPASQNPLPDGVNWPPGDHGYLRDESRPSSGRDSDHSWQ